MRGTVRVDEPEYLTDAFTREAVDFIARHRDEPFFLYLSYNAVHTPLQASDAYLDRFAHIPDVQRRTYAAMLSALDDGVGAVLDALREAGVEERTLVFFLSDNGGAELVNASRNGPLRAAKGQLFEGGIRVPFLVRWPDRLPAGATYDLPVISLDVFPTALAAAGVALPSDRVIDGANLLPHLTGELDTAPHDSLFWRFGRGGAVRRGRWKLIRLAAKPRHQHLCCQRCLGHHYQVL